MRNWLLSSKYVDHIDTKLYPLSYYLVISNIISPLFKGIIIMGIYDILHHKVIITDTSTTFDLLTKVTNVKKLVIISIAHMSAQNQNTLFSLIIIRL